MIRTKLARKVLTTKEQKHLTKIAGVHNMKQMGIQADFLKDKPKACFECNHIIRKLKEGGADL